MRMPALILAVMATTLLMVPASAQERDNLPRKEQIDESSRKVTELQKERIATLKEAVDQLTVLFRNGKVEFDEVIDTQLQSLEAELEVAEKDSDRITLYKNMVGVLKQYEALADERVKSGRGTQAAALKIKVRRLEAEIRLEQAKAKEARESK